MMTDSKDCLCHSERIGRLNAIRIGIKRNTIKIILDRAQQYPDENLKVLIKKGPVSLETSLQDLKENYASKPEWKVIEEGGVLSVPVEEFRMTNPPKLNRSGKIEFVEKKGKGAKNLI